MTDPRSDSDPVKAPGAGWSSQAQAEGWHRWQSTLAQYLDPATETLFDRVGIRPGDRVLDVAAGSGGQTILAARRAGAGRFVLAIDVSA